MTVKLQDHIHSICRVGDTLWHRGWAEMSGGNMSIDVTKYVDTRHLDVSACSKTAFKIPEAACAGHSYLVTTAGSRFRDLPSSPNENILLVYVADKLDGYTILQGGAGDKTRATSELSVHLAMHAYLSNNNRLEKAVLHTHPTHLIALTQIEQYSTEQPLNQLLASMHPEISIFVPEGVGLVPYCCPGSDQLASRTIIALKNRRIIVWEKHGCIAVGDTIEKAFDYIDIMEKAAEIFFLCKGAGFEVQGLSEAHLRELHKKFYKKK